MWQESKLFKFLLVLLFGGSIVLLAAHDLQKHYKFRQASSSDGKIRVARDLYGDFPKPKGPPEDAAKASPGWNILGYEIGGDQPPAKLAESDRKALERVINEDTKNP